MVDERAHMIGQ